MKEDYKGKIRHTKGAHFVQDPYSCGLAAANSILVMHGLPPDADFATSPREHVPGGGSSPSQVRNALAKRGVASRVMQVPFNKLMMNPRAIAYYPMHYVTIQRADNDFIWVNDSCLKGIYKYTKKGFLKLWAVDGDEGWAIFT